MTAITQAAFARQHSVSRTAVAKWRIGGYISMVDGLVDVESSDARLQDCGLGRFNPTSPPGPAALTRQPNGMNRHGSTRTNIRGPRWPRWSLAISMMRTSPPASIYLRRWPER